MTAHSGSCEVEDKWLRPCLIFEDKWLRPCLFCFVLFCLFLRTSGFGPASSPPFFGVVSKVLCQHGYGPKTLPSGRDKMLPIF